MKKFLIALMVTLFFIPTILFAQERDLDSPLIRINSSIGISKLIFSADNNPGEKYETLVNDQILTLGLDLKLVPVEYIFARAKSNFYYGIVNFGEDSFSNVAVMVIDTNFIFGPRLMFEKNKNSNGNMTSAFFIPSFGMGFFQKEYSLIRDDMKESLIRQNLYLTAGIELENFEIKNEKRISSSFARIGMGVIGAVIHGAQETNANTGQGFWTRKVEGGNGARVEIEFGKTFYKGKLAIGYQLFLNFASEDEFDYEETDSHGDTEYFSEPEEHIYQFGVKFLLGF